MLIAKRNQIRFDSNFGRFFFHRIIKKKKETKCWIESCDFQRKLGFKGRNDLRASISPRQLCARRSIERAVLSEIIEKTLATNRFRSIVRVRFQKSVKLVKFRLLIDCCETFYFNPLYPSILRRQRSFNVWKDKRSRPLEISESDEIIESNKWIFYLTRDIFAAVSKWQSCNQLHLEWMWCTRYPVDNYNISVSPERNEEREKQRMRVAGSSKEMTTRLSKL